MSNGYPMECDWRDGAWSFVLGSATEEESADFREHLLAGCACCGAEVARARTSIGELDLAAAERECAGSSGDELAPELRQRLRDSLPKSTPAKTPFSGLVSEDEGAVARSLPSNVEGVEMVLSSEEGWSPSQVDGVRFRLLAEDRERGYATALVHMDPGSAYPPHRHGGREECYVLSGDLCFGGHQLFAGDFQVAEEGSVHPVQATEDGCLLLIVSSLHDEPIPG